GRKSIEAQILMKKAALDKLQQAYDVCTERVNRLESLAKMESMNANETETILSVLEKVSQIPELEKQLQETIQELSGMDLTWLMLLDKKIKALETDISGLEEKEKALGKEITKKETQNAAIAEEKIPQAQAEVNRRRNQIDSL